MTAYVLVHHREPPWDPGAVRRAYLQFTAAFGSTPGVRSTTLLRSATDPEAFTVLTEWSDLAAFESWRTGPARVRAPTALTPLQDRERVPHWEVYETTPTAEGHPGVGPDSNGTRPPVAIVDLRTDPA